MFCKYCGSNLTDDAMFCSSCGVNLKASPVASPPIVPHSDPALLQYYSMQKEAQRNSELQVLDRLINHFSQKIAQFNRYDELCEQLIQFEKGSPVAMVGWGCVLAIFGAVSVIMFYIMAANSNNSEYMAMAGLASALLVGGILMIVFGIRKRKIYYRDLDFCRSELNRISEELYSHYLAYPNCPLGAEYVNPYVLQTLRSTLMSGRADTIKESLNLMIGDTRRDALEKYLRQIERNTAQSRNIGAIFLASRFFR